MRDDKNFKDRLNLLDAKLDRILNLLSADKQDVQDVQDVQEDSRSDVVVIDGMQSPWVLGGLEWDGKSEIYDEEELHAFLGFNPNGNDADGKSWCAGFWISVFELCGIDTAGLNLSAVSFRDFGYDVKVITDKIPNGSILVFQPKAESRYRISHVGVKVDDDKLFGGNQGDSAQRSNLAWYMKNAELVAVRCPNGYDIA